MGQMSPRDQLRPIVMAKGLGRGAGSDEFRVVLPEKPVGEIASRLRAEKDWGQLLSPLYERTAEDLSRQYAILLSVTEFGAFSVAPTRDAFGRRSVIILGLVGDRGREHEASLAAEALAQVRRGIPEVARAAPYEPRPKLKEVAARVARREVSPSPSLESDSFLELMSTAGCQGAATPLMLGLGADVVVGTAHEAASAVSSGRSLRAFLDVRSGRLRSLLPGEPDMKEERKKGETTTKARNNRELLQEVLARLDGLDEEVGSIRREQRVILEELRRKRRFL